MKDNSLLTHISGTEALIAYLNNDHQYIYKDLTERFQLSEEYILNQFHQKVKTNSQQCLLIEFKENRITIAEQQLRNILNNLKQKITINITHKKASFILICLAFITDIINEPILNSEYDYSRFKNLKDNPDQIKNWHQIYDLMISDMKYQKQLVYLNESKYTDFIVPDHKGYISPAVWLYCFLIDETIIPIGVPATTSFSSHNDFFKLLSLAIRHDKVHYDAALLRWNAIPKKAKENIQSTFMTLIKDHSLENKLNKDKSLLFLFLFIHEIDEPITSNMSLFPFEKYFNFIKVSMPNFEKTTSLTTLSEIIEKYPLFYSNDIKLMLRNIAFEIPKFNLTKHPQKINLFVSLGLAQLLVDFISLHPETATSMGFFLTEHRINKINAFIAYLNKQVSLKNHFTEKSIILWNEHIKNFQHSLNTVCAKTKNTARQLFIDALEVKQTEQNKAIINQLSGLSEMPKWIDANFITVDTLLEDFTAEDQLRKLEWLDKPIFTTLLMNKTFSFSELMNMRITLIRLLKKVEINKLLNTKLSPNVLITLTEQQLKLLDDVRIINAIQNEKNSVHIEKMTDEMVSFLKKEIHFMEALSNNTLSLNTFFKKYNTMNGDIKELKAWLIDKQSQINLIETSSSIWLREHTSNDDKESLEYLKQLEEADSASESDSEPEDISSANSISSFF